MNNPLAALSNDERIEYLALKHKRDTTTNTTDDDRFRKLLKKMGFGGKSRRNPSKKRSATGRHRSSKVRKVRKVRKSRNTRRR